MFAISVTARPTKTGNIGSGGREIRRGHREERREQKEHSKRRRNGRQDLATFQLTNCKYLDCGCRMTLINIADGTECRSKGGRE